MDQIIVRHINGTELKLQSKENCSSITKATQTLEFMGQDVVDISVESSKKLKFDIGYKINIIGRDYTLNMAAKEKKLAENSFSYELHFEGVQYDLLRASYNVNVDTTTKQLQDLNGDSLTGNLRMFLDVLVANANRVFPDKWSVGTCPLTYDTNGTEEHVLTLSFSETDNCLSVLQSLCMIDKFNKEFRIDIDQNGNRTINIGLVGTMGNLFPITFRYGKGKGLYDLTREKQSSSNIITRLNVFGSTKNINTTKYRAMRLCLEGKTKANSFLEDADCIAKYGVWEATKCFEDVYPNRIGVVSSVDDYLTFADTSMDFDLNERNAQGETLYIIPGSAPKVCFNTGQLAGYSFEVNSYDNATKKFKLIQQTDENGYKFPSSTTSAFQFAEGDQYVLVDLYMPATYISKAEHKLAEKGQKYFDLYKNPNIQYGLTLDRFFLRKLVGENTSSNIFWTGDYIDIKDDDFSVNQTLRVKGFTRDLLDEFAYTLTISDLPVSISTITQVLSSINEATKIIKMNNLDDPAKARRNYLDAQEVLNAVFDTEGQYYTEKIKPLSIDTTMLSVGAKSMQFGIMGLIMQVNYNAQKNRVVYSTGTLSHYTVLDANGDPRVWNIAAGDTVLGSDGPFYVYVKCERGGTGAVLVFSQEKITTESDGAFYHFLAGVINSVDEHNARAVSLMYGFSTINGRFIKTGRVSSTDGETYFDLDSGEIRGDFKFKSGVSVANTINNMLNEAYSYSDSIKNDLQGQIDGQIISWFRQVDPTLSNSPASDWNTEELRNKHANDTYTNLNTGGCWRFQYNGTSWEWGAIADTATQQALVLAGKAQDTADGKRRVFTAQPTAPYEIGDLWVQGSNGDIMKCSTTRLTPVGAYYASDWSKASKYTDDTAASEAQYAADAAQTKANQAVLDALNAQNAANSAQSTANTAQNTATSAETAASSAQSAANAANTAAANALATAVGLAYLKTALGANTEIDGGLVSTTLILMRTVAGLVTGGISGLANDNIGFWTGGTYANALANAAKIVLRKDGSGYLAGGKITFDSIGKILVGPFNINPESISTGTTVDNMYMDKDGIQFYNQANSTFSGIGKNMDPSSGLLAVSKFQNNRSDTGSDSYNVGVEATANGAAHNYAVFSPSGKIISRRGGVISWDDSYIGDAASDIIEKNFKDCSQFLFTGISVNGINVRLPSSDVIPSGITFKIDILVADGSKVIYIKSVIGGQMKDWNNGNIDTLELDPGDAITLRYYNGNYHLISWMK